MALEESGYKLVLQGYQQFISGLGKISSESAKMGSAMDSAAKKVDAAGTRVANVQARYTAAVQNSARAANQFVIATNALYSAQLKEDRLLAKLNAAVAKHGPASIQVANALENWTAAVKANESAVKKADNAEITYNQTKERSAKLSEELNSAISQYLGTLDDAAAASTKAASGTGELLAILGGLKIGLGVVIGIFQTFVNIVGAAYNAVKNLVEKGINLLVGALRTLGNIVDAVLKPFGNILQGIFSVAGGMALYNVIRSIGQAFQDLIGDLQETLSYFQRLNIQLQALQARDIAEKFGVDMATAFRLAGSEAQKLRNWVIQLAVTTPFTVKSISTTLAMANAMGLNINMAKELTVATGNFTAAMGLTDEHMYRIIYNFAQMLTQGKLNKREFRDLANSMVPAMRILDEMAKKAGMTSKEFQKLAFEGGVPVEAFLKEFIRMANEDFPGAMKRMARTFEGVKNNIIDFIQTVIGLNVLGPTFDRITEHAANALDKLLTPAVRNAAYAIGQILLSAFKDIEASFNRFWNALSNVAAALGIANYSAVDFAISIRVLAFYIAKAMQWAADQINKSVGWIGKTFATISNNAGQWGYNIIAMIAKGMAAAAKLIAQVINNIARMIAWFLQAFSPPRALPDLPKWGMAAMRSYLEGFTEADFSVLKDIQGPVEQALGILEKTGQIKKGSAGKIYKDISMAIAKVISTGKGEAKLYDMIDKKIKVFGGDIAKLTMLELELARATEMVRLAEKAVEDARKAEETSRARVSKEIREYNDLLTAGASKSILNAKLAAINADEKAAAAATVQRIAAEDQLEAAQALMEGLEEQVKLQKELVDQLLGITDKMIGDSLADSLSGASAAAEDLALDMEDLFGTIDEGLKEAPKFAPLMEDWSVAMEEALAQAQLDWDKFWKDMQATVDNAGLPGALGEIITSFDTLREKAASFWKELNGGSTKGPGGRLASDALPSRLETFVKFMKDSIETVTEWGKQIGEIATNLWRVNDALIELTGQDVVGWLSKQLPWWFDLIPPMTDILTTVEYITSSMAAWGEISVAVKDTVTTELTLLSASYDEKLSQIWTKIEEVIDAIIEWGNEFTTTKDGIIADIATILADLRRDFDAMLAKVKEIFEGEGSIPQKIGDAIDEIIDFFEVTLANAWQRFTEGPIANLIGAFNNLINKIKEAIGLQDDLKKGENTLPKGEEDKPLPGKPKTTTTTTTTQAQFGSKVQKGRGYIIGEKGWEYFFPGVSGLIANQTQVSKMIANSMRNLATIPRINAQPIMSQNILNFNMGGMMVNSPITLAQIESVITNTIRREFS